MRGVALLLLHHVCVRFGLPTYVIPFREDSLYYLCLMRSITGSPLKSFQESIEGSNDSRDLIGALNAYYSDISKSDISEPSKEEAVNNAVDLLRRWMKSDSYKSQIGGGPMMRSEIGDEESAMYEKIGAAGDELKFERLGNQTYGESRPLNEAGRYLDYRKPVFGTFVDPQKKDDIRGSIVHELYHTVAEPTNIGRFYMDNLDSRYFGRERMKNLEEDGDMYSGEFLSPLGDLSSQSKTGRDIRNYKFVVDSDPNKKANSIFYFRNPTELSARTRDLTNLLQERGDIPKDQFSLEYDDILKAYEMGNETAKELLYAFGVYTGAKLREDLIPESREKYNTYLKGKL